MTFQRKLCTTSMLIAAWYALPAAADLQIHSASILSNTLCLDGAKGLRKNCLTHYLAFNL